MAVAAAAAKGSELSDACQCATLGTPIERDVYAIAPNELAPSGPRRLRFGRRVGRHKYACRRACHYAASYSYMRQLCAAAPAAATTAAAAASIRARELQGVRRQHRRLLA